jgi:hypothetical protein
MDKKVFIIAVKETNLLCSTFECYDSFEKAKQSIYRSAKNFPDRKVLETNLKNEFEIVDKDCIHIHTLKIIDLWLR